AADRFLIAGIGAHDAVHVRRLIEERAGRRLDLIGPEAVDVVPGADGRGGGGPLPSRRVAGQRRLRAGQRLAEARPVAAPGGGLYFLQLRAQRAGGRRGRRGDGRGHLRLLHLAHIDARRARGQQSLLTLRRRQTARPRQALDGRIELGGGDRSREQRDEDGNR